jgi:hypothetical protein
LACLGELGITKCDAALFITKLPEAEHDAEEWQAAMQALLLVAEHDGANDVRAHRCNAGDQPPR